VTLVRNAALVSALVAADAPRPLDVALLFAVEAKSPTLTPLESAVEHSTLSDTD
jgi:hypothetical protein